ncbi:hypothetical protein HYX17_01995 [Candidatus Woesearchaeota archaeon]|nr:hypothetical protein [Candidatus Woesearchaeota archaeon]
MKIIKKLNIFVLIAVLLSINVIAFGVSTSYWPGKPLVLEPGESMDVYFTLQNGAGATEDVIANVDLTNGKDITQIIDGSNSYLVKAGGESRVNLRVQIPDNANVGDTYTVGISVTALPSGRGGPVTIGSSVDATFPVLIQPHEPVPTAPTGEAVKGIKGSYNIYSVVGLLLIIAIVIFIFYELHNKKSGTEKGKGKKRD